MSHTTCHTWAYCRPCLLALSQGFSIFLYNQPEHLKEIIFIFFYHFLIFHIRNQSGPRYIGTTGRNVVKIEDSPSGYARPSILKDDDIRAMDAEDLDDGGWAGAQEEIDYSMKLNFDDDEPPSPVDEKTMTKKQQEEKVFPRLEEQKAL